MEHVLTRNRLASQLDLRCQNQLLKHGDWVDLNLGQQLHQPGIAIEYVYFPIYGVIALMMQHATDKPLTVALIGNEGMLGVAPALGVQFVLSSAVVLAEGAALRISIQRLYSLKLTHQHLGIYIDRYIAVRNAQLAQVAVCNGLHNAKQRLARLLLAYSDRLRTSTFSITQELLATLLGLRRAGINKAANELQQANILHYSRGNIEILNSSELSQKACYCYEIDKEIYESILFHH
jgi:CRP-like cAMP-binding protein